MQKIKYFFFILVFLPLTFSTRLLFAAAASPWPSGPLGDLKFETSEFMKTDLYSHPSTLSNDASTSGAYGPFNKAFEKGESKEWYIESQRFAFDTIGAGLAWQKKEFIDKGLHILDWGFSHQNADGSFSCPDTYHSTAFFVEAAARTALLLQASPFKKDYQTWIEKVKPKLLAAGRWMADPKNEIPGMKGDQIYTHRFYENAAALGFVGVLADAPNLVDASKKLVRDGIARQNPAGFNPEKGGHDTSYHAVGLLFALRYYSIVADNNLRKELSPMLIRGLEWLRGRIKADGSVDQTGNTRTGSDQEIGRDKKPKTMSYGSAAEAFGYWGQIQSNADLEKIADSLYQFGHAHPH